MITKSFLYRQIEIDFGEFMIKVLEGQEFKHLAKMYVIPNEFYEEYKDSIDKEWWRLITIFQCLSLEFIEEYADYVNWYFVTKGNTLPEDMIRKYYDRVSWYEVGVNQKVSEDFLLEFYDRVDWMQTLRNQDLSENFLRELIGPKSYILKDYQYYCKIERNMTYNFWSSLSCNQNISDQFIEDFKDKMCWVELVHNRCYDESFIMKYKDRLKPHYTTIILRFIEIVDMVNLSKTDITLEEFSKAFLEHCREKVPISIYNEFIDLMTPDLKDIFRLFKNL